MFVQSDVIMHCQCHLTTCYNYNIYSLHDFSMVSTERRPSSGRSIARYGSENPPPIRVGWLYIVSMMIRESERQFGFIVHVGTRSGTVSSPGRLERQRDATTNLISLLSLSVSISSISSRSTGGCVNQDVCKQPLPGRAQYNV